MEKAINAKNLELADLIRERDRARFGWARLKSVSLRMARWCVKKCVY